jgi:UDP-N-acetylglucosamine 2-epimerase (hydrolysing)
MSNSSGNKSKVRKILFLTGTRADFGKLKPLMKAVDNCPEFESHIFITGMHMFPKYGSTGNEITKSGFHRTFSFINQKPQDTLDTILANTILGLGNYLGLLNPDMMIIHGDRVEALAGAIVGAMNNIIVGHIEGGEVSGTIDESIRHSISKLAHLHFVANYEAQRRLLQMGEDEQNIYVIGSPDMDLMISPNLPSIGEVKNYYEIPFENYSILIYHPVTTNLHNLLVNIKEIKSAVVQSARNYVIIYPNNDPGADIIIEEYLPLKTNKHFRIFPSLRFEYFLTLLKNCDFIIGNSSAGIREAPFYSIPAINIGNRQKGRFQFDSIINTKADSEEILSAISKTHKLDNFQSNHFGEGKSAEKFINLLRQEQLWHVKIQKFFIDRS